MRLMAVLLSVAVFPQGLLEGLEAVADKPVLVMGEDKVARVEVQGDITEEMSDSFKSLIKQALDSKAVRIEIAMDTPGGDFDAAHVMAKLMEDAASKTQVVCVVDGDGASAGFYLLQACQVRKATARSALMAHEPYYPSAKPANRLKLEEMLADIAIISNRYSEHCAARMKITPAKFRELIKGRDWWMTPAEALKAGAIDEILPSPNKGLRRKK